MKRILCLILAFLLLCPTLAMAAATKAPKKDYYAKKSNTVASSNKYAKQDNDIMLYTFSDVASGSLPGGISGSGAAGEVTTEEFDVGGFKKNCLVVNDTDSSDSGNGVNAQIATAGASGRFIVEYRFKYVPDEKSQWVNLAMDFSGEKSYMARFILHSSTGNIVFNNTGSYNKTFEKLTPDSWYTIKYLFDTENNIVEASFLNEATGRVLSVYDAQPINASKSLTRLSLATMKYGGKLVFDYIRISKSEELLSVLEETSIIKGRPQIRVTAPTARTVPGRINFVVDGEYKYTTMKPYVSESGNVMATAKNLALMFGLGYSREGSVYTMANDKTTIVIDMTSGTCEVNGKKAAIKEAAVVKDLQVFVPAESIASILGAEYSYDADSKLVTITAKGGNK